MTTVEQISVAVLKEMIKKSEKEQTPITWHYTLIGITEYFYNWNNDIPEELRNFNNMPKAERKKVIKEYFKWVKETF